MFKRILNNVSGFLFTLVLIFSFCTICSPAFADDPAVPDRAESPDSPIPHTGTDPSGGPIPPMGPPMPGPMPGGESRQIADDGKFKVMTLNGVETPIAAGTYKGKVVIEELDGSRTSYYKKAENIYRSALFIEGDAILTEKSATSALKGGKYDADSLSNVSITARSPYFNGITIVDRDYSIKNLAAEISGDGGNDMAGTGSVVSIFKGSNVSIFNTRIKTSGTGRAAVFAGSDDMNKPARVSLKDTTIIANGNNTVEPTAVWMLGLFGDVRAVQYVGYFDNVYDNVNIKSAGWAILSVDDVMPPTQDLLEKSGVISAYDEKSGYGRKSPDDMLKLYYWSGRNTVKNSELSILGIPEGGWGDGYGSYSIGANLNVFDNTKISNVTYGSIVANEYASVSFINGSVVNSNRFGVYSHSNKGGVINVDNATMNTREAVFLVKSSGGMFGPNATMIDVYDSKLNNAGNGVILLFMDNDDPGHGSPVYTEDGKTILDEKIDIADSTAVKDNQHDLTGEYSYRSSRFKYGDVSYMFNTNVVAIFTDCKNGTAIKGDFYNARTAGQNLVLHFNNSEIAGIISSGTAVHDVDIILKSMKFTDSDFKKDGVRYGNRNNLGDVTVSPGNTVNNGVILYLEKGSVWKARGISYISKLVISPDSRIEGKISSESSTKSDDGTVTSIGVVVREERDI